MSLIPIPSASELPLLVKKLDSRILKLGTGKKEEGCIPILHSNLPTPASKVLKTADTKHSTWQHVEF